MSCKRNVVRVRVHVQVLKHMMLREDQGCVLFGADPVVYLSKHDQLIQLLLSMLHALDPITSQRKKLRQSDPRTNAATSTAPASTDSTTGVSSSPANLAAATAQPPVVHPELEALVQALPFQTPYFGYRGDVLAILSNSMFARPAICSTVVRLQCVELILAQVGLCENFTF